MSDRPQDDDDKLIWGATAFGAVMNKPPTAIYRLLAKGALDADRIGGSYVSTPRRLKASGKPVRAA